MLWFIIYLTLLRYDIIFSDHILFINSTLSFSGAVLFLKLDADEVAMLLSETFKPDEEFVYGPQSMLDQNQIIFHSQESLSFDGVCYYCD